MSVVACLVDTTRCIGCRSCQVACKQAHGLPAEKTRFFAAAGYQNPATYSSKTRTYISYHELADAAGNPKCVFLKHQCLHCADMRCASVCGPVCYSRTPEGVVVCDASKCIGCAACVSECPYGVPVVDTVSTDLPQVHKCTFCIERQQAKTDEARVDGKPLSGQSLARHRQSLQTPACAKACPGGALLFGPRDRLLIEARRRIAAAPERYINHIYGEKEMGGTAWLYLASVPFGKLGLPVMFREPSVPQGVGAVGWQRGPLAALGPGFAAAWAGLSWFFRRRDRVRAGRR